MKCSHTGHRKFGLLRSVAIVIMGVMLSMPGVQVQANQSRSIFSPDIQSTAFIPLAFKLASLADTPTLRPLFARVLALDGNDDYAYAPDRSSLDLGRGLDKDFTIELFINIPAGSTGLKTLLHREHFYLNLLLTSGPSDGIEFVVHFKNGNLSLFPVLSLKPGWHHLAIVFNEEATLGKDLTSIYLDGALEATHTDPDWGPVLDSIKPLYLGYLSSETFGGDIEEVRLSSTARYSTPVFSVPDKNFNPDEFTRALWHFDEAPGSTSFADYSGKENRLTGINGATIIEPSD